uniref:Uncharacterized protein n=1 Tax=Plectus sambesii TaxID=2011161 RepID=A0A914XA09_9BILA
MSSNQVLACLVATVLLFVGSEALVRQCSCEEQAQCLADLKAAGTDCVDECWSITSELTSKPKELRKCFSGRQGDVENVIDCFNDKMEGCVPDAKGPMIAPQSIDTIMDAAERKIRSMIDGTMKSGLVGNMDQVVSVAEKYAKCAKQCILKKTADGICLKKYKCEPMMPNEAKAKTLLNKCARFDFKKEGGPLCQCALNAGVKELSSYCSVLSLMGPQH